jgi:hypothetical protein
MDASRLATDELAHSKKQLLQNRGKMSMGQKTTALRMYLETLDKEQFGHVLNEVLSELHKREFEQIKKDVLTYGLSRRAGKLGA